MRRRQLLSHIGGVGIAVGAAGCIGGDDANGDNGTDNGTNGDNGNGEEDARPEDLEVFDRDETIEIAGGEHSLSFTQVDRTAFTGDNDIAYEEGSVIFIGDMDVDFGGSLRDYFGDELEFYLLVDSVRYDNWHFSMLGTDGRIFENVWYIDEDGNFDANEPFRFEGVPESTLGADEAVVVIQSGDTAVGWDVTEEFDAGPFPELEIDSIEFEVDEDDEFQFSDTIASFEATNPTDAAGTVRFVPNDGARFWHVQREVSAGETISWRNGTVADPEDAWLEVRYGFDTVSEWGDL